MKKKIISAIALISAAILTLGCATGCGKKGKTVDDIKKAGELVIATSPDFPPFEELKSNGAVEGIEIDIMNIICKKLGVTLKIEQMDDDMEEFVPVEDDALLEKLIAIVQRRFDGEEIGDDPDEEI